MGGEKAVTWSRVAKHPLTEPGDTSSEVAKGAYYILLHGPVWSPTAPPALGDTCSFGKSEEEASLAAVSGCTLRPEQTWVGPGSASSGESRTWKETPVPVSTDLFLKTSACHLSCVYAGGLALTKGLSSHSWGGGAAEEGAVGPSHRGDPQTPGGPAGSRHLGYQMPPEE